MNWLGLGYHDNDKITVTSHQVFTQENLLFSSTKIIIEIQHSYKFLFHSNKW